MEKALQQHRLTSNQFKHHHHHPTPSSQTTLAPPKPTQMGTHLAWSPQPPKHKIFTESESRKREAQINYTVEKNQLRYSEITKSIGFNEVDPGRTNHIMRGPHQKGQAHTLNTSSITHPATQPAGNSPKTTHHHQHQMNYTQFSST